MEYTWYDKSAANEDAVAHDPGFLYAFGWTVANESFQQVGVYCFNLFDDDAGVQAATGVVSIGRGPTTDTAERYESG